MSAPGGVRPNLASWYTREVNAHPLQWDWKRLKTEFTEAEVKLKQDAIDGLNFLKAKWNQWGVTRVLYLDQAIDKGFLQLPSALLSLIWRTAYAATAGLLFIRTGEPDLPRERMIASWNTFTKALANLAIGVAGAVWPILAVKIENKLYGPTPPA